MADQGACILINSKGDFMTDKKEKTKVDESILDAANKIWVAGLGAVHTAEKEGSKLFKTLVDKGTDFQSMRREISQKQLEKIGQIVKGGVGSVKGKIDDITQQKEGMWDKLKVEQTFASVIKTFGVATKKEIDGLNRKIDALSKAVNEMKAPPKKAPAKKTPAKKATPKAAVPKANPKASK
jgi:poly(hydroxyalkanoate) granule-associated protein